MRVGSYAFGGHTLLYARRGPLDCEPSPAGAARIMRTTLSAEAKRIRTREQRERLMRESERLGRLLVSRIKHKKSGAQRVRESRGCG